MIGGKSRSGHHTLWRFRSRSTMSIKKAQRWFIVPCRNSHIRNSLILPVGLVFSFFLTFIILKWPSIVLILILVLKCERACAFQAYFIVCWVFASKMSCSKFFLWASIQIYAAIFSCLSRCNFFLLLRSRSMLAQARTRNTANTE